MTAPQDGWLDGRASRLVRPYAVTGGRVRPDHELDLTTQVADTGQVPHTHLDPEHAIALTLCRFPTPVAEVAARMRLPVAVAKILLADLISHGAATIPPPRPPNAPFARTDLEAVLAGLRVL